MIFSVFRILRFCERGDKLTGFINSKAFLKRSFVYHMLTPFLAHCGKTQIIFQKFNFHYRIVNLNFHAYISSKLLSIFGAKIQIKVFFFQVVTLRCWENDDGFLLKIGVCEGSDYVMRFLKTAHFLSADRWSSQL